MKNKDTAIAILPAPNADGRTGCLLGNRCGEGRVDELQHDGAGSSLVYGKGVRNQALSLGRGFSLDMVATFFHDPLRKHAEMTDKRNAIRKYGLNSRQALTTSFDLHQISARFAKFPGILNGETRRCATASRQVGGDKCFCDTTRDGAGVVDHVGHRNMCGVWMTKNHHSQGIADQQQVKPALVEETRGGVVVGGESGQAAACNLGGAE